MRSFQSPGVAAAPPLRTVQLTVSVPPAAGSASATLTSDTIMSGPESMVCTTVLLLSPVSSTLASDTSPSASITMVKLYCPVLSKPPGQPNSTSRARVAPAASAGSPVVRRSWLKTMRLVFKLRTTSRSDQTPLAARAPALASV